MSKIELFTLLSLGFLIFEVIFIRLGFFFGITINQFTLILSFIMYLSIIIFAFSTNKLPIDLKAGYLSLISFVVVSLLFVALTFPFSHTYDISWDGQGYHQTAVIALANGWNPVRQPTIELPQRLPSQIFAEGYPSALWEIEASIYALTGKINSAKIVNSIIALIAGMSIFSLLRMLRFGNILAAIISLLMVVQPVFIIQMLTFMQDGFGYELIIIATASLVAIALSPKSYGAMWSFLFAEILLVSTKYSHLPIAMVLGVIFFLIIGNRFLNKEHLLSTTFKLSLVLILFIASIFAYLPYGRNTLVYHAPFYPTNIPDLMGAVRYNNIPTSLQDKDKASLLFYGIFSRAQTKESGDPRSPGNIAQLKIPFTFTSDEITDAAGLFNNRVGSGGPLFSGIVLLILALIFIMSFLTKNVKERYTIYASYFAIGLVLFLALLAPTPNLLRYVNQLQLLPFLVLIPFYAIFNNIYMKSIVILIFILIGINTTLYTAAVFQRNVNEITQINNQFSIMRNSEKQFHVKAQHFYSSYIVLEEQHVPFMAVNTIRCNPIKELLASSTTTQYCIK